MSEALADIARRKANLLQAQQVTAEKISLYREKEAEAEQSLENTISHVIVSKQATLNAVARELNCSRDKVKAMAERARVRNMKLMRSGHDD